MVYELRVRPAARAIRPGRGAAGSCGPGRVVLRGTSHLPDVSMRSPIATAAEWPRV
jgi:hypothetical protein